MPAKPITKTAKLFQNGRSQAVRLPMEFRFEGTEVRIRKVKGGVLLEPAVKGWGWLDTLEPLDDDAVEAIRKERIKSQQKRPELDKLFR